MKIATAAEHEKNVRNEANAQTFLRRQTPDDAPFVFPECRLVESCGMAMSATEYVKADWFATKEPRHRMLRPMVNADLEDIFQVMLFLHRLKREDVPAYFLRRASKEFTLEKTMRKLRDYLAPAVGPLITAKEAERLEAMMRKVGYRRRFVHHDMVPSNFARLPDGRLLVTDAEWSRWEMKWFDVAYHVVQMHCLYGYEGLARRSLRFLIRRFGEELPRENIEEEIFFPIGYWMAASLFLAVDRPASQKRVRALFDLVLAQDLKGMMGV